MAIDDCHAQVGDSAETVALTLPAGDSKPLITLHQWMERSLPELAALDSEQQDKALAALWDAKTTICSASCSVVAFASGSAAVWCKKR